MLKKTGTIPPLNDINAVLNYGSDAQARVAEFSEIALENLRTKDLGDINGKMTDLIVKLKETEQEEKSGVARFFQKHTRSGEGLRARYRKACEAVDKISLSLQGHRDVLLKDIEMLEMLYNLNEEQYNNLTMYLEQGKSALEEFRIKTLTPLQESDSDDPSHGQAVQDALEQYHRFEKKLHDLELTRVLSLQMAPQIRMLQSNNTVMAEKIQSSVVNTIPLWKSQMVLTLGMENSRSAIDIQSKVSEITDSLLKQNAKTLKETTLAVTREAERSNVKAETLKETNALLIEALDEMLKIREEGRKNRESTEEELQKLNREVQLRLLGRRKLLPSA